jgi:hypothetical protein
MYYSYAHPLHDPALIANKTTVIKITVGLLFALRNGYDFVKSASTWSNRFWSSDINKSYKISN